MDKISEFRAANADRVLAETAAERAEYEARCREIDEASARKKKRKQLTPEERLLMKLSASEAYIPGSPEAEPDSIRPAFPNKGFADND
jgi:hypothetical protein